MTSSRKRKQSTLNHDVNQHNDELVPYTQYLFDEETNGPRNMVLQHLSNYDDNQVLKVKYDSLLNGISKYTHFGITYTDI